MSQAFSLYGELTVLQNLTLHAQLFHLPEDKISARVTTLLTRFGLSLIWMILRMIYHWVFGNVSL